MTERTWPRPIPNIGDATSVARRAAQPDGWAFDPDQIEALHAVLAARRDIRRYRPNLFPRELLRSVLAAGHQAPSAGHSQPWTARRTWPTGARRASGHVPAAVDIDGLSGDIARS